MRKLTCRIFLIALAVCGSIHPALAEQVVEEPRLVYIFRNDYSVIYDTFDAALAKYKASVAEGRDPGTGLVHWRVVGAEPSGITMNGKPVLMPAMENLKYNSATQQYDTWVYVPRAGSGGVNTIPECGAWFRRESRAGSTTEVQLYDCISVNNYPEPCDTCGGVGNPILPSTRMKLQEEVDYESAGPGGLRFARIYRSDRNGWTNNYAMVAVEPAATPDLPPSPFVPPAEPKGMLGCRWDTGAYSGRLRCFVPRQNYGQNQVMLRRGGGPTLRFGFNTTPEPAKHVNDRWWPVFEDGAKVANDIYNSADDSVERYSLDGYIQRISYRNGNITRFGYEAFQGPDTPTSPSQVLKTITDHFGRQVKLTYNQDGRLETMTTPANEVFTYRYDEESGGGAALGNLTSVTYPDQRKRIYWYNEPAHRGGAQPFALTGITDENGARFATFKYDAGGYALSTEHAGEVEKYKITSPVLYQGIEYRYVVDPLGATIEYQYAPKPGGLRLAAKSRPAGAGSPAAVETRSYDANENVETIRDYNGVVTKFEYDLARNLQVVRTDAFGLPEQRVTSTEWHPSYRLPKRIAEPKRLTTFDYDSQGNLKTRSIQATTDEAGVLGFDAIKVGAVSTWRYTYNGNSQLETITGPRAGGVDKTTYGYDWRTGDLLSITNAAGHVTTFGDYDGNGRPRLITAPNRTTTRLSYSPRGWLESRTVSDGTTSLTTTYGRDNAGQLTSVTNPDNTVITYVYDDAHRLTDIYDTAGNKIHYVLNNMGSPLSEEVTDPTGTLKRQVTNQYDILNRLEVKTGGAQ